MMNKILRIVQSVRKCYWWLVRPTTRGVRAIVADGERNVLLVKHRYLEGWFLPGGKVRRGEKDETALMRELWEELGIRDVVKPEKLGEYVNTYEYKKDTIVVYVVRSFRQEPRKHFEIEEQRFFRPQELPENVSPGTRRRIEEWLGQRTINNRW